MLQLAKATAERAMKENGGTEPHVLAYATQALAVWPAIDDLATYYDAQKFVDDEFARGRKEASLVPEAIEKIAPLREPMREAVFTGWREAAGDKKESPRAIVGASFEACMRVATLLFARPKTGKQSDEAERVLEEAMGACRRGVGAVSALPEEYRSFEEPLRGAAIAFGNAVDDNYSRQYTTGNVNRLVKAYLERWPQLPAEPAEKPGVTE